MPTLFIDIETIPDQATGAIDKAREGVKPPGTYKKPESIAGWWATEGEQAVEQAWRKTALNGTYGQVAIVSYAVEDGEIHTAIRGKGKDAEKALLETVWEGIGSAIAENLRSPYPVEPLYIGHNVTFDLRFLYQRSMIRRVRPTIEVPHNASPWSGKFYDTMYQWSGPRDSISLANLAAALGVENPYTGDIEGATVWDAWAEGRFSELLEYNRADVSMVRDIYRILRDLEPTGPGAAASF